MGGPVRLKAIRIIEPRQQRSTVSASPTRWEYRVLIGARGFFSDRDLTQLLYGKEDLDAVRSTFPAFEQALSGARAREAIAAAINRREKLLRTEITQIQARLYALERSSTNGAFGQNRRPQQPKAEIRESDI